jgi:thymidylate synthase
LDFTIYDRETNEPTIPLLSTKRMFTRGIIEELLWFFRADTDAKHLSDKNVHIWDGNSSRSFLDRLGFADRAEGDCGPIYGFQWRHFGAEYRGPNQARPGEGIDQLQYCLQLLRNEPTSRRIFMSAWNPIDLPEMCLPPCHVSYQFYSTAPSPFDLNSDLDACLNVPDSDGQPATHGNTKQAGEMESPTSQKRRLHCQMVQRSADLFLGVPFNIVSTAILTHVMAKLSGMDPGTISVVLGDVHLYEEHIPHAKEQLQRHPSRKWPRLQIRDRGQEMPEDFVTSDFVIGDYTPHGPLSAPMAA